MIQSEATEGNGSKQFADNHLPTRDSKLEAQSQPKSRLTTARPSEEALILEREGISFPIPWSELDWVRAILHNWADRRQDMLFPPSKEKIADRRATVQREIEEQKRERRIPV